MSEENVQQAATAEQPWIVNGVAVPRSQMTDEQRKAYMRDAKKRSLANQKLKSEGFSREAASLVEVKRAEALEILTEVGAENRHVAETIADLLEVAARQNKLCMNDFMIRYGLRAALVKKEPEPIEGGPVAGELSTRLELYRLWDASASPLRFDDWLKHRRLCKTDCVELGHVLGKDFHPQPHGQWRDFLPSFNPDGLRPGYSQEDVKQWLAGQVSKTDGLKRDYLQLCSRNSYKSSFSLVWAITAVLCCPDIRLLLCSETTKLSKAFIKSFRAYWEKGSGAQNEQFHELFPEHLIEPGDGSVLSFVSPMAHLNLPQSTAEVTSLDSSSTGSRFDIGLLDDIISNQNTGNEDIRESSTAKFDAIQKLREVGGITLVIGTPWNLADTYATILTRNEEDSTHPWAVRRDPAWTVKAEFKALMDLPKEHQRHLDIHDLTEEMVVLLFPSRLTFAFLRKELGNSPKQERFFRSQNLVEFVPEETDKLKLNFDRDLLTKAVLPIAAAPQYGDTCLFVDSSFSTSPHADLSALSVLRLFTTTSSSKAVCVMAQSSGRFRGTELAFEIVKLVKQWGPRLVVLEKVPNADLLEAEIRRTSMRYDIHVPLFWMPADNQRDAKIKRIKAMEILVGSRLFFASGPYIDDLFAQLERLSFTDSPKTKKNDLADSVSIGVKFFRLELLGDEAQEDTDMKKLQQEAFEAARRQEQYNRIFGSNPYNTPAASPVTEEVQPAVSPLDEAAARLFGANSPFRLSRR